MQRNLRIIRNLLAPVCCLKLGLCLLLISGSASFAQSRRGNSRPTRNPAAQGRTPSPTPTPTPTPNASPPATPSVTVTPMGSPSVGTGPQVSPSVIPTSTATPNQSDEAIFHLGDSSIQGPWWLVLLNALALIASPLVMLWLKSKNRGGSKDGKTTSVVTWVIVVLFVGLGLFLILDLLGRRSASGNDKGINVRLPGPTATPEPCPSPEAAKTQPPLAAPPPQRKTGPTPAPAATPTPTPTPVPSPTPTATPVPTPFLLSIASVKLSDPKEKVAGLGDTIIVAVKNLDAELKREELLPSEAERVDPRKYVLFLDDMEIKKLYPISFDPGTNSLTFKLARPGESKEAWASLLAAQTSSTRLARASVGPEGKAPLPNGQTFNLRIYNPLLLRLGFLLFLAAVAGFIVLAKKTPVIRDSEPAQPVGGPLSRPYSLALTQVAWWSFIILGSFLFIAFVTWDFDTITTSSLVLLGIGTGTALGSRLVDKSKREATNAELGTLEPQRDALKVTIGELEKNVQEVEALKALDPRKEAPGPSQEELSNLPVWKTQLAAKRAELKTVRKQLVEAQSHQERPITDGFLSDLLTDANGATFHRLQVVVWTVVLGIIFMLTVWRTLSMPEFSETLLALMGISAGTYLGFKIPERQTSPQDTPAQPASPPIPPPPAQPKPADESKEKE